MYREYIFHDNISISYFVFEDLQLLTQYAICFMKIVIRRQQQFFLLFYSSKSKVGTNMYIQYTYTYTYKYHDKKRGRKRVKEFKG